MNHEERIMNMTNREYLWSKVGAYLISNDVDSISDEGLRMIACPFESVEDPDSLEIEGCPSVKQCAICKRQWLKAEVKGV